MLKVVVVEDEELVRKGIVLTVDWAGAGCAVVGEAANGEEGLEVIRRYRPDLIVTDIRMPKLDGIEMLRRLREEGLLSAAEVEAVRETTPFSAEYGYLYRTRLDLLRRAAERTDAAERARVAAFLTDNPYLAQFCDFMARRRANGDLPWYRWQDAAARDEQEYEAWGFIQYRFMSQWQVIHDYAAHRGV